MVGSRIYNAQGRVNIVFVKNEEPETTELNKIGYVSTEGLRIRTAELYIRKLQLIFQILCMYTTEKLQESVLRLKAIRKFVSLSLPAK